MLERTNRKLNNSHVLKRKMLLLLLTPLSRLALTSNDTAQDGDRWPCQSCCGLNVLVMILASLELWVAKSHCAGTLHPLQWRMLFFLAMVDKLNPNCGLSFDSVGAW